MMQRREFTSYVKVDGGEWTEMTPSTKKAYSTKGGAQGQITHDKHWRERVASCQPEGSYVPKATYKLVKRVFVIESEEEIPHN